MYNPVHINLIQNHQASGVFASSLEALVNVSWTFYHMFSGIDINKSISLELGVWCMTLTHKSIA